MNTIKPEISGHSIVFRGNFNTRIFQPSWFAGEGIIRKTESDNADIEVIHRDISIFSIGWLRLQVTQDSFNASTTQEPYFEIMRDFAISTFEVLVHTPIKMMGINFDMHVRISNEESFDRFINGFILNSMASSVFNEPSLSSYVISDKRLSSYKGQVKIKLEKSTKLDRGLYISINDHFEAENIESVLGAKEMLLILKNEWESSYSRSFHYYESILEII